MGWKLAGFAVLLVSFDVEICDMLVQGIMEVLESGFLSVLVYEYIQTSLPQGFWKEP